MKQELMKKIEVVNLWIKFYEEDGLYGSNYRLWMGCIAERDVLLAKLAELD